MSLCGNRSPITGECIIGCPGFGGCMRGTEVHLLNRPVMPVTYPLDGHRMGIFSETCLDCRITAEEICNGVERGCTLGRWPQAVTVPLPKPRGRIRAVPL